MDRRSIIYVTLLTLCFFGINWYVDSQRTVEPNGKETVDTLSSTQISSKTIAAKSLPLLELYNEQEQGEFVGYALQQQDQLLTLSWKGSLPKQVYVGSKREPAILVTEDAGQGEPALYSIGEPGEIKTTTLPVLGSADLQVVTLGETPEVQLGQYSDGNLFFPGQKPNENALVLLPVGRQYLPVGYYDIKANALKPLSETEELGTRLQYQNPDKTVEATQYYALENDTIQLVFSTLGGSIAEINLPFLSKDNNTSVVRPINFDRTIEKKYKQNARFPMKPAYVNGDTTSQRMPQNGGYYPLLRRGVIAHFPQQTTFEPIRYHALNLVAEDPALSAIPFSVTKFTKDTIVLTGKYKGKSIVKTFRLPQDTKASPYVFTAAIDIDGDTTGMYLTSGVPEVELISGSAMPTLKLANRTNQKIEQIKQPKPLTVLESATPSWMSNGNGFFGVILDQKGAASSEIRASQVPGDIDPSRLSVIDPKYNLYPRDDYPGYEILAKVPAANQELRVFAGPFDTTILKTVDKTYTVNGTSPNYIGTQSFHGWFSFISEPFAKLLLILLNIFHTVTGSWGLSIILLTVVLRAMLYPLNDWSIKSMAKMQEVGPKIERAKERYKKDQQRMNQEVMKIYKEEGGSPISGCLPMLIQMPFLIGMFDLLKSSFELRGATFIPGWIDNLAAPDVLFSWSYPIPFIGTSFHLLPILLGGVMFLQQVTQQKRSNRKHEALTDQQKQQKNVGKIMTVVFTFMFYKFPSGLNLYWISSMALSALQQWVTLKRQKRTSHARN